MCIFLNLLFSESTAMKIAACGCSTIGSSSSACDVFGKCPCKVGHSGKKCDQCQTGYNKDRSGACIGISYSNLRTHHTSLKDILL